MSKENFVGRKVVKTLYQYDLSTGLPTGVIKNNVPGDPDYIPPTDNSSDCPIKTLYGNDRMQQAFTKNNCSSGYVGSTVIYVVPENKYKRPTLAEANQLAITDIQTNGQAYANANGTCTVVSLPFKWKPDPTTAYCEQAVQEEAYFTQFASPVRPFIRNGNLMYLDRSLSKVISFNPRTLTQAQIGTINALGSIVPSNPTGQDSRPSGWYYHPTTDYAYIQGDYTGGIYCIRMSDFSVVKHFPSGTNGAFQRGEIVHIPDLNEVWALGNSTFTKINLSTNNVVTGGISIIGSVQAVLNQNGKIYVVRDLTLNRVEVYNSATGLLIATINNVAQNVNPNNGNYTLRGFYSDAAGQKIYIGEVSSTPSVIIINTSTNTIQTRLNLPQEGYTYGSVGVIDYNPVRQRIYVGGGLFSLSDASDSQARMWTLASDVLDELITPSANRNITDMIYYGPSNSVYVSSRGRIPQDTPNTGHESDGVLFKFN